MKRDLSGCVKSSLSVRSVWERYARHWICAITSKRSDGGSSNSCKYGDICFPYRCQQRLSLMDGSLSCGCVRGSTIKIRREVTLTFSPVKRRGA